MTRFIVRGVPERMDSIEAMAAGIPGLEVAWDERRNAMLTFFAALRLAGDDAAVHLEDDAELCGGFMDKITAEIAALPSAVHQFFSRVKEDLTIGTRWRAGTSFTGNVCFYLPPRMSADLLAFAPGWRRFREHPTGYDLLMQDFFKQRGVSYLNHVPSLVQHRELVSAINPRRARRRLSKTFAP